jgi:hypothetical protein
MCVIPQGDEWSHPSNSLGILTKGSCFRSPNMGIRHTIAHTGLSMRMSGVWIAARILDPKAVKPMRISCRKNNTNWEHHPSDVGLKIEYEYVKPLTILSLVYIRYGNKRYRPDRSSTRIAPIGLDMDQHPQLSLRANNSVNSMVYCRYNYPLVN